MEIVVTRRIDLAHSGWCDNCDSSECCFDGASDANRRVGFALKGWFKLSR